MDSNGAEVSVDNPFRVRQRIVDDTKFFAGVMTPGGAYPMWFLEKGTAYGESVSQNADGTYTLRAPWQEEVSKPNQSDLASVYNKYEKNSRYDFKIAYWLLQCSSPSYEKNEGGCASDHNTTAVVVPSSKTVTVKQAGLYQWIPVWKWDVYHKLSYDTSSLPKGITMPPHDTEYYSNNVGLFTLPEFENLPSDVKFLGWTWESDFEGTIDEHLVDRVILSQKKPIKQWPKNQDGLLCFTAGNITLTPHFIDHRLQPQLVDEITVEAGEEPVLPASVKVTDPDRPDAEPVDAEVLWNSAQDEEGNAITWADTVGGEEYTLSGEVDGTSIPAEVKVRVLMPKTTVAYQANGGEGVMTPTTGRVNEQVKTSSNGFTRKGYTFANWNTVADGSGVSYNEGTEVTLDKTDGLTLYAQWKANTYVVSFDANGGTGKMKDQQFTYDQKQQLAKNAFTRSGYVFDGWKIKNGDGKTSYSDGQKVLNLSADSNGVVVLQAQWKSAGGSSSGGNGGGSTPVACVVPFSDVSASTPHRDDICWLAAERIATGYADGEFKGMTPVYRQDMAAFLHRMHDNVLKK
ncbi:InlB B-repeat-containing protein [Bifidobacterium miconisargentati]|uniref:InlB B-repeat-containing protein n=1 Tax=Bifidobacterium miconisargentati TaxID=2834437 RepID=UPI001BDC55F0|nr:InlB B-repeat-containing protein [Bifidobacterium miconisargentati]MBW3090473.1 InlB B-repeat-containing protein [Bifidobacterium miconisargentati]